MLEKTEKELPNYGNWVPRKFIYYGVILGVLSLIGTILIPLVILKIAIGAFFVFDVILLTFCIYAYYMFSARGGNLQEKIHDLLVSVLPWDGNGMCLDIGCGNAPIAIKVAKRFSNAKIIASDYWGETVFEYDQKECVRNAKIENVIDRMEFKHANAAKLPFDDESMDAIVSNLTFHEVRDFKRGEKHKSFLEALRVLKKGGAFAVQDVFTFKAMYGDFEKLKDTLEKYVSELNWIDTNKQMKIPRLLQNPIFLGDIGIFYGIK